MAILDGGMVFDLSRPVQPAMRRTSVKNLSASSARIDLSKKCPKNAVFELKTSKNARKTAKNEVLDAENAVFKQKQAKTLHESAITAWQPEGKTFHLSVVFPEKSGRVSFNFPLGFNRIRTGGY